MNMAAHVSSLYTKKAQLEDEIHFEQKRPLPNFMKLADLKKQKLILKQMIQELSSKGQPATA